VFFRGAKKVFVSFQFFNNTKEILFSSSCINNALFENNISPKDHSHDTEERECGVRKT
jgi:hypothetical protein